MTVQSKRKILFLKIWLQEKKGTNILSQLFDEKNQLLVYTEGRTVNRSDYESTGRSFFEVLLVVWR